MTTPATKPIPIPETEDLPHWEGLKDHRLVLSKCDSCGFCTQRRESTCRGCLSESFTWTEVSGRGSIYSFTVVHQTWVTGFSDSLGYVVVAVSVDECPALLLTTNLIGDFDPADLRIGLRVRAAYEPRGDENLLQFELDG